MIVKKCYMTANFEGKNEFVIVDVKNVFLSSIVLRQSTMLFFIRIKRVILFLFLAIQKKYP